MNPADLRGLYAIADTSVLPDHRLLDAVAAALRGGAHIIQYRDKIHSPQHRAGQAAALCTLCRRARVPFIVNDDVALAAGSGADGVHLGRGDATLEEARAELHENALIGISCYDELERAIDSARRGASYIAFGSFFPSVVKPGAVAAPTALLREARSQLDLPLVAIGGITPENTPDLIEAGADAVAVISGLFARTDVATAARAYARHFDGKSP